jgi:hypothetical protein
MLRELLTKVKPKIKTKEKGRIKRKKRQANPAHLKGPTYPTPRYL